MASMYERQSTEELLDRARDLRLRANALFAEVDRLSDDIVAVMLEARQLADLPSPRGMPTADPRNTMIVHDATVHHGRHDPLDSNPAQGSSGG
jgi:hypothetical protein